MKTKILTCLMLTFCFGQSFSQELRMMPREVDETNSYLIDFEEDSKEQNDFSLIQLGSDLYNLQLVKYQIGSVSLGINSRLEEELPYENNAYDYTDFYYLDFGVSYMNNSFSLSFSIENFFNLDKDDFSIDPILEKSNGITSNYYFSHETDQLISMTLTYSF